MHSVIHISITAQKSKLYWLFIKNQKKKKKNHANVFKTNPNLQCQL